MAILQVGNNYQHTPAIATAISCDPFSSSEESTNGRIMAIKRVYLDSYGREHYDNGHYTFPVDKLDPLLPATVNLPTNKKSLMTNLISTYKKLTKKEPQKSFFKAGVTDENDNLTNDGEGLFLNYLLEKYGADFKKDVIDEIVAEFEKDKK